MVKFLFNITLDEAESTVLETVVVNNTTYLWSDGSNESATILEGETKHWSINIGNLQNGTNIEVVVESASASASSNTTVKIQPAEQTDEDYIYDNYGGVGLFSEGIHVIATQVDPTKVRSDYEIANSYWEMLAEHETTTTTTDQEYICLSLIHISEPTRPY